MFVMVALGPSVVQGQGGTLRSSTAANGFSNIVRYCSSRGSYVNASMNPMGVGFQFSLTDLAQLIDAQFPNDDYVVLDMELLDEMVFFCGFDRVLNSGLLGWFNIEGLFYGSEPIHIDNSLLNMGLLRLENIEVFRGEGSEVHVVGYGVCADSINRLSRPYPIHEYWYLAFEAVGFPNGVMNYRIADLRWGGLITYIRDVKVTDNYVVFLECDGNQYCKPNHGVGIDLYAFPKYDMFSSLNCYLQQFQTIEDSMAYRPGCTYVLRTSSDPDSCNAKMVSIGRDKLAVCSHRVRLDYNYLPPSGCDSCTYEERHDCYIVHRVYDLSPLLVNNPAITMSATTAKLPSVNGQVVRINGFVNEGERYAVLHEFERGGTYESAVTMMDFTGGTPATITSNYQTIPTSNWTTDNLCANGAGSYLVSGASSGTLNHYFMESPFVNTGGGCSVQDVFNTVPLPIVEAKSNTCSLDASGWVQLEFMEHFPADLPEEEMSTICE